MPHVLAAPDKFRGTATAAAVAGAVARAAAVAGWTCDEAPVADGGEGILEELVVACDVTTPFVAAAEVFAPQKGATPAQVALLKRRLERLAQVYEDDYGVDVRSLPGSGAAGGLAGGLAAMGARLVPGFDLVADALDLPERVAEAQLVVTGEGYLDDQSFDGKAVGGVVELAR